MSSHNMVFVLLLCSFILSFLTLIFLGLDYSLTFFVFSLFSLMFAVSSSIFVPLNIYFGIIILRPYPFSLFYYSLFFSYSSFINLTPSFVIIIPFVVFCPPSLLYFVLPYLPVYLILLLSPVSFLIFLSYSLRPPFSVSLDSFVLLVLVLHFGHLPSSIAGR